MCISATLRAVIRKPSLATAVPVEKAWASTEPPVTSFRPARWAPITCELLGDSGTMVSSWNPASFLAKHYRSATGLSLTNGLWVSFKQKKTRNVPNTQANLFANVPLISCMESRSEAAKLYFYHLSFPFNFGFGCTRSMFLLPVYSFIKSSPLWAQYFCLLHRSCFLFKRSAPLSTLSLSESDYMYLTKKDMEFTF